MKCPFCGNHDTQVKDSRPSDDGATIRRRRVCAACDARFTTYERVQLRELTVIKRSGERRPFDRDKIVRSLSIALRKRPVDAQTIDQITQHIVQTLESRADAEVTTDTIGELVMRALQPLDQVAYIRYASVYRNFHEAGDFEQFMKGMERGEPSE